MSNPLDHVAAAAEEAAEDQRQIARTAVAMQRRRARGWTWAAILDREDGARFVELLRRSGRRIADATAAFTRSLAVELEAEGASRRAIARRLGVTHQRVSAMLDHRRRSSSSNG